MKLGQLAISGPFRLDCQATVRPLAERMLKRAQEVGDVPADRSPLDPHSEVIWTSDTGGKAIALAIFFDAGRGRLYLDFLYTDEPARERGHGRALIHQILEIASARGFKRVLLGTCSGNDAMRHLARRCGFVEDGITYAANVAKGVEA